MSAVFVTATGTDVGKTFVAAGLIRSLRARGRAVDALKPVASGFDRAAAGSSDSGVLLTALGQRITEEELARISPWRFAAPLSPDMAARREGRSIDFEALVALSREVIGASRDAFVIEGVGGIMVPLDGTHTVLDWMAELHLPLIVVGGSYLGTISHTLSALDVLRRRHLEVAALVISETPGSTVDLAETIGTIAAFAPGLEIVALARQAWPCAVHPALERLARRLWP